MKAKSSECSIENLSFPLYMITVLHCTMSNVAVLTK